MEARFRESGRALPCDGLDTGYATGVFSSRTLERATYDSVAFRFVTANEHPDHDTITAFRRCFLTEIEGLFVQVDQDAIARSP